MEFRNPHFNCVQLGDGSRQHPWHLLEMSLTGARIRVPASEGIPDCFTLVLQSEDVRLMKCRIVWRSESQIGVRFDDPYAADPERGDECPGGDEGAASPPATDGQPLHAVRPPSQANQDDFVAAGNRRPALPELPEWARAEILVRRLFAAGQRLARDRERLLLSPDTDQDVLAGSLDASQRGRRLTVWAAVIGLWAFTVLVLVGAFALTSQLG